MKEYESFLSWVIQNSSGHKTCILNVHQPDNFILMPYMYILRFSSFVLFQVWVVLQYMVVDDSLHNFFVFSLSVFWGGEYESKICQTNLQ